MIPTTPNEQSINRWKKEISRIVPQISANGITSTHAIMPNSITLMFPPGL
jgi:hypothetical protein